MNPFDFVNSINYIKKDIMTEENEKDYNSFLTNRQLSYFSDTVLASNEMNINSHLDNKLQYHFLINIIRKKKRFSKWDKNISTENLECVKEYYGYSNEKAKTALMILSPEELIIIKNKVSKGGRK